MPEQNQEEQWRQADDEVRKNLPSSVKLVRTLRGHTGTIGRIAWSPDGRMLASPSADGTIRLWDAETGQCVRTLGEHRQAFKSVAFAPAGEILAGASDSGAVTLWETFTGKHLHTLKGHTDEINTVVFDPDGRTLFSGSSDLTIRQWRVLDGQHLDTIQMQPEHAVVMHLICARNPRILAGVTFYGELFILDLTTRGRIWRSDLPDNDGNCLALDPSGTTIATGGHSRVINLWDVRGRKRVASLEAHTGSLQCVAFSSDGKLFASKSVDDTVTVWRVDSWEVVAFLSEPTHAEEVVGLAFHPALPFLAVVGSDLGTPKETDPSQTLRDRIIHIYELDLSVLYRQPATPSVSYTSAKVVLVGDSGVGKTGLGWRLAHGEFKEHASTHGQQFWLLKQLCQQRRDGTQCEAVLWDLAGQPDYRLIHALFLDDADLALVLFDPTRNDDPLSGVEFWLRQLRVGTQTSGKTPTLLVAARSDRGTPRLTRRELDDFCEQRGIAAYVPTSAKAGDGIQELFQRMKGLIPWDDKPAIVTTETFKRIKDFVLNLKENRRRQKVVLTPEELRKQLEKVDHKWRFSDPELLTSVGHLANHGYVTRLKTSRGEPRFLLAPELLNNLAASFVLEARRNVKGLGSLEEQRLLSSGYKFPELEKLSESEGAILLDSAAVLFLEHNICFRETEPLHGRAYLVFPELINLKRPMEDDAKPVKDGVAYTVSGAVENVYASLVVLMGYTQALTRTNQWRNHARYEVGNGQVCGFRLEEELAGELEFVLYFGTDTDVPVRMLFQSLFENLLARRNLTVRRFEPVACKNGHLLNRAVVRQRTSAGANFAFCSECGERITLPRVDQPIQLTGRQAEEVEANRRAADQRSRFEQVLFRLKTYVAEQKIASPKCFISYAWGNLEQERWVEKSLATDLQKAGISVVLDRWEKERIGASVPRFVERVSKSDRVIVVGTPFYRKKYDNEEPMRGFVAVAEDDLIGKRMIGTEAQKQTVLPILLEGTEYTAFPYSLHGRVYADFRKSEHYFHITLDLLLSLYQIEPRESVAIDLQEALRGPNM